jgi:hypothetical protein
LKLKREHIKVFFGGTGTTYDRMRTYYRARGYVGTIGDMQRAWLSDLGFRDGGLNQRWRELLSTPGDSLSEKVSRREAARPKAPPARVASWWENYAAAITWAA